MLHRTALVVFVMGCAGARPGDADAPNDTDAVMDSDPGVVDSDTGEPSVDAPTRTRLPAGASRVRRLAAREIQHALDDLTGVEVARDVVFPQDVRIDGFDSHAEAGPVGELLVEQLDRAAEEGATLWSESRAGVLSGPVAAWPPSHGCEVQGINQGETHWAVWVQEPLRTTFTVPTAGTYAVAVTGRYRYAEWGNLGGRVQVAVDGTGLGTVDFDTDRVITEHLSAQLSAGSHTLTLAYQDGLASEADFVYPGGVEHFPLCYLAHGVAYRDVRVVGPVSSGGSEQDYAAEQVVALARRAWRRPLTADEVARLTAVVTGGYERTHDVVAAAREGAHAVLLSPHFLLVVDTTEEVGGGQRLDDHSLAARLSLALWASLPDAALMACADAGRLYDLGDADCGLPAQVRRMMADPRFDRSMREFAYQWLDLDTTVAAHPPLGEGVDRVGLLADMVDETTGLVVDHLGDGSRRPRDLLDAAKSAPSAQLAAHYGLTRDGSGQVDLASAMRRGLLGQGSVLVGTSSGGLTSPIRRGIWTLDKLRCDPPDPPPPGVPTLPTERPDPNDVLAQLAAHSSNPSCAGCHQVIDPLGLSLEGFGPDGGARPLTIEVPPLPDGTAMDGLDALRTWVQAQPDTEACMASWLATYLVGASVTVEDLVATGWLDGDTSWPALIEAIVRSPAMLERAPVGVP